MGNSFSLTAGHSLLDAAVRGDHRAVQTQLEARPGLVCYTRLHDRASPLLVAAGVFQPA